MQLDTRSVDKYGFLTASPEQTRQNALQENARSEKWVKMLSDWSRYTTSKAQKLKNRIRKGIPSCFRGRVWWLISGSEAIKSNYSENYYQTLLGLEAQKNVEIEISLDLERTYPNHIKFRGQAGRESLFRVLKAYAIMDPEVSYTQGMSFIVAMFLIFLDEEQSFWLLVTLLTQYEFRRFFIGGMPKVYSTFYVANGLLRHNFPSVFKKFKENGLSISMYATQWFMTGFTSSFKIDCVLRIWDCFLHEGFKVFYRCFLAIMAINKKVFDVCNFEKTMEIFREIGQHISTENFIKKAFGLGLSQKIIDRLENDYKNNPKNKYIDWVIVKN